ncbi:MAG TPA: hypothetical protein VKU37_13285 [Verrucomicrobiae bacterium]|nr:hypothetical protein [Verrucomicrobiae bacterium]
MSTVAEIKEAIERLSPRERCELEALLHPRTDDDWDREMQADAAAGKFDRLKDEAAAERRAGKLRDFPKPRKP